MFVLMVLAGQKGLLTDPEAGKWVAALFWGLICLGGMACVE